MEKEISKEAEKNGHRPFCMLDKDEIIALGRAIFCELGDMMRAEVMIECSAFDSIGHLIMGEKDMLNVYISDVLDYTARAYQSEYDEHIANFERQGGFDEDE